MNHDYKNPIEFYKGLNKREQEACKKYMNSNIETVGYDEDFEHYKRLEKFYMPKDRLLLEKLKNFEIIDNCGKIDSKTYFVTYRSKKTNKIYIHFFGEKENYIIFLDSDFKITPNRTINKKNYFYNCSLYAIYDLRNNQYLETHGLEEKTRNYYHKEWMNINSYYAITLKQIEDGTYMYEFIKEEKDSIRIRCIWKNYDSFQKGEKPQKIEIEKREDKINKSTVYDEKTLEEEYLKVQSYIYDLGFRFLNRGNKKYIDCGIKINEMQERITYIAIKNHIDNLIRKSNIKRIESTEVESSETESHHKDRRSYCFHL